MKKGMAVGGTLLVVVVLALMAYVRLAPIDAARWHLPVSAAEDLDMAVGAVRVVAGDADTFAALNDAALDLPRTHLLAGTAANGRITYVTRSLVFGFPDMTTIELAPDGHIRMFGRLRFGGSDLGVNRKRLEGLIATLK